MRLVSRPIVRLAFAIALLPCSVAQAAQPPTEPPAAEEPTASPPSPAPVVRARIAGRPGHRAVRAVTVFLRDAGRMDWSRQGRIAFDRRSDDGFYDIYLADGDGETLRCVTCENFVFHKIHALAPVWHPSGDYLVIQVQTAAKKLKMEDADLATPFRGLHSELWAITTDGKNYWQLTSAGDRGGAVLDAVFSFEADKLAWSERVSTRSGRRFGLWATRLATFEVKRGAPRLGKIRTVEAGETRGLEVVQSFTPDDLGLLVVASPLGQPDDGIDVVRMRSDGTELEDLTNSVEHGERLARYAPRSRRIVFTSDRNLSETTARSRLPWRDDVWMMNEDGTGQERLTFFNHPDSDHYLEEAMISDLAWSPDGDRLLVHVVSASALTIETAIWAVDLEMAEE